tara:strand:- start:1258 stop:1752 length:495 start_codon:yes stop_codon:yes gene_type:complete
MQCPLDNSFLEAASDGSSSYRAEGSKSARRKSESAASGKSLTVEGKSSRKKSVSGEGSKSKRKKSTTGRRKSAAPPAETSSGLSKDHTYSAVPSSAGAHSIEVLMHGVPLMTNTMDVHDLLVEFEEGAENEAPLQKEKTVSVLFSDAVTKKRCTFYHDLTCTLL